MTDFLSLFKSLPQPEKSDLPGLRFETSLIPGYPSYYLGKSSSGEAALLIDVADVDTSSLPPMRLQALTVYHRALCRITYKDHDKQRSFTVIWHSDSNAESRALFLGILEPVVASLGEKPVAARIATVIEALARMFRALTMPARKTTQGLWAELLLIALSADAVPLTRAWHLHADDRFDFNAGKQRIEVKSAGVSSRRHHFSFEQLHPPAESEVIIASIMVKPAAGGTSIRTLMNRVLDRLAGSADLQTSVYEVVAETLGRDLSSSLEETYDEQLGSASIWFVRNDQIPSIDPPIPHHVSEVQFVSDLTGITPLSSNQLSAKGGLFAAVSAMAGQ